MPESQYRARQVGPKTHEVVEYDHDESLPGKPLHILIPGGLVALASLAVIILVAYLTWMEGQLGQNTGLLLIAILAPFYIGGVFLFSYGYELYNIPRAIRLTAIIVFLTAAAVVIVAVLFFVLAGGKGLPDSKKRSSSRQRYGQVVPPPLQAAWASRTSARSSPWEGPHASTRVKLCRKWRCLLRRARLTARTAGGRTSRQSRIMPVPPVARQRRKSLSTSHKLQKIDLTNNETCLTIKGHPAGSPK
jgi:hypothetical protein